MIVVHLSISQACEAVSCLIMLRHIGKLMAWVGGWRRIWKSHVAILGRAVFRTALGWSLRAQTLSLMGELMMVQLGLCGYCDRVAPFV
jgi:hypothetical protein